MKVKDVKAISWLSPHGELCSCSLRCGHFHHQVDNMHHGNMWSCFGQEPGRWLDITRFLLSGELRGKRTITSRPHYMSIVWYKSAHARTHTHTHRQTHFSLRAFFCIELVRLNEKMSPVVAGSPVQLCATWPVPPLLSCLTHCNSWRSARYFAKWSGSFFGPLLSTCEWCIDLPPGTFHVCRKEPQ